MKSRTVVATMLVVAGLCLSLVGSPLFTAASPATNLAGQRQSHASELALASLHQNIMVTDEPHNIPLLNQDILAWLQNASTSEATYEQMREWSGLKDQGLDFCLWIDPISHSHAVNENLSIEICHVPVDATDAGYAQRLAAIHHEQWGMVPVHLEMIVGHQVQP